MLNTFQDPVVPAGTAANMEAYKTMRILSRMTTLVVLALGVSLASPVSATHQSRPAGGFDPSQVKSIEEIVRDYILDHPNVILEAVQELQRREKQALAERSRKAVLAHQEQLNNDPTAPVVGNPEGDVTIVEFFDYRCPYCRDMAGTLRDTVEADGNIRLVMKEFPILGPQSIYAARAALAADRQGRYETFHFELMNVPGQLDEETVLAIARDVGLDIEQLEQDMRSDEIGQALRRNRELAGALEINGTPAFVIGERVLPGAMDARTLRTLVNLARKDAN